MWIEHLTTVYTEQNRNRTKNHAKLIQTVIVVRNLKSKPKRNQQQMKNEQKCSDLRENKMKLRFIYLSLMWEKRVFENAKGRDTRRFVWRRAAACFERSKATRFYMRQWCVGVQVGGSFVRVSHSCSSTSD